MKTKTKTSTPIFNSVEREFLSLALAFNSEPASGLKSLFFETFEAPHLDVSQFCWEFAGGDAQPTARCAGALLYSAYGTFARAYLSEAKFEPVSEIVSGSGSLMSEIDSILIEGELGVGTTLTYDSEQDSLLSEDFSASARVLTQEEALSVLKAAQIYTIHLSRMRGENLGWVAENAPSWSAWLKDQVTQSRKRLDLVPDDGSGVRLLAERAVRSYEYLLSTTPALVKATPYPSVNEAREILVEYVQQEDALTGVPRGEKLLLGAADRQWAKFKTLVKRGDMKALLRQIQNAWELLCISRTRVAEWNTLAKSVVMLEIKRTYEIERAEYLAEQERIQKQFDALKRANDEREARLRS